MHAMHAQHDALAPAALTMWATYFLAIEIRFVKLIPSLAGHG